MKLFGLTIMRAPAKTVEELNAARECVHDWTNWTEPDPTPVKVATMFGGGAHEHEAFLQTRRCLKCNLVARHFA